MGTGKAVHYEAGSCQFSPEYEAIACEAGEERWVWERHNKRKSLPWGPSSSSRVYTPSLRKALVRLPQGEFVTQAELQARLAAFDGKGSLRIPVDLRQRVSSVEHASSNEARHAEAAPLITPAESAGAPSAFESLLEVICDTVKAVLFIIQEFFKMLSSLCWISTPPSARSVYEPVEEPRLSAIIHEPLDSDEYEFEEEETEEI